jgi:hypothetical protein
MRRKLPVRVSLTEVEDYTVNIGGAAITSITTAKTGIDLGNEKSISDVLIYPNPASSVLNVRMTDSRKRNRLINFLGQQVDTGELSESGINVSTLETGVYILEVNDGQNSR